MNMHSPIFPASFKRSRIDAIKLVYEPGMSAAAIADALGRRLGEHVTRNSVIGIYGRNKEALADYPLRPKGRSSSKSAPSPRYVIPKKVKKAVEMPEIEPDGFEATPTEYDATALLKTLWELDTRTECKWPVADCEIGTLFCGHESDGTYCHHHRLRSVRSTHRN